MGLITMRGNFSLGVSSSTSLHRRGKFGEMLNFFDISILGGFGGSLVYFCSLAVRYVFLMSTIEMIRRLHSQEYTIHNIHQC